MRPSHLITIGCLALGSVASADTGSAQRRQLPADVFFAFDSSALDAAAQAELNQVLAEAEALQGSKIILDAHADIRGTAPYNVGLSIRRAERVRDHLTAHGVSPDRIIMAAYGKDGPRRKTFAQDRRVTISLTAEPLYSIIDHSGPYATAVVWHEPVTYAEIQGPAGRKIDRTARR